VLNDSRRPGSGGVQSEMAGAAIRCNERFSVRFFSDAVGTKKVGTRRSVLRSCFEAVEMVPGGRNEQVLVKEFRVVDGVVLPPSRGQVESWIQLGGSNWNCLRDQV